ncbi:XRE family transcriptional regulator [Rhizohabitans arisaemae]|uniref:XRE family transcriptional regulator n=1 Tax=Rhizohabitans arisaemae TaxID=2720610 RepID=UPI0024B19369|nr:XRE family transcriptional regulator [Rhizohabitans arisaemae]
MAARTEPVDGGQPERPEAEGFGALLRRHRHAAGLTLEELADASGVSVRALGDMERGRSRSPHRRCVEAVAGALRLAEGDQELLLDLARTGRSRDGRRGAASDAEIDALYASRCAFPRRLGDFVGRGLELAWLGGLAKITPATDGTAVIAVISGPPGYGKTALALQAVHTLADQFPDGRFFLDLRGMDALPLAPGEGLTRLLRALGVPDSRISPSHHERADLYRSLMSGRRALLVLDNAADESQIRPLLPGGGSCLVVVTSRRSLAGLEAVHRLRLEAMLRDEAADLLDRITGSGRAQEEPGATEQVVRLCGNLPLALRIAGNRLASRPGWTMGHLAGQLADEEHRLAALTAGDLQVRTAFALSYRQLTAVGRTVFRRLAQVPGPDAGAALAAVLAEVKTAEAELALEELVELGLLQESGGRYRFHDLVRLFARGQLAEEETPAVRQATEERMAGWLLGNAITAGQRFDPTHGTVAAPEPGDANLPEARLGSRAEAMAWLDEETANWFGAVRDAAANGRHRQVLDVARAMHWYSDTRQRWEGWQELFSLSATAARRLGSRGEETIHLNYLAWAWSRCLGRHQEALNAAVNALALARQVGDRREQAWALTYAANAHRGLSHNEQAADCLRESVAVFESLHDLVGYTVALRQLGEVVRDLGDPVEALELHRRTEAIYRDPANGIPPTQTELGLGLSLLEAGRDLVALRRWADAAGHYRSALRYFVAAGDHWRRGTVLYELGCALKEAGDEDGARAELERALDLFTEQDDRIWRDKTYEALADVDPPTGNSMEEVAEQG